MHFLCSANIHTELHQKGTRGGIIYLITECVSNIRMCVYFAQYTQKYRSESRSGVLDILNNIEYNCVYVYMCIL
jgi:hypothetical protein